MVMACLEIKEQIYSNQTRIECWLLPMSEWWSRYCLILNYLSQKSSKQLMSLAHYKQIEVPRVVVMVELVSRKFLQLVVAVQH